MGTFFTAQITGKCCMRTLGGHHSYTAPAQESGRSCPFVIAMSMWLLVNWIIYFFIMFRKLFLQFSTYNLDTWSWHKKTVVPCSAQKPSAIPIATGCCESRHGSNHIPTIPGQSVDQPAVQSLKNICGWKIGQFHQNVNEKLLNC